MSEEKCTQQIIIYKSECFNMYKNNKKDNTHTRTHTHYQGTSDLYMTAPTETEDM